MEMKLLYLLKESNPFVAEHKAPDSNNTFSNMERGASKWKTTTSLFYGGRKVCRDVWVW